MQQRIPWPAASLVLAVAAACGGGGNGTTDADQDGDVVQLPPPVLTVDSTLQPRVPDVLGFQENDPRPVAVLADEEGTLSEFVENEIVLVTDDEAEAAAFASRWGGEVMESFIPSDYGLSVTAMHVIRIDTSMAETDTLAEDLRAMEPNATGSYRVSSQAGLDLIAAAAREAAAGSTVAMSWVFLSDDFIGRTSMEAPTSDGIGGYSPNAFNWPFMNERSVQDIAVAEAWRALAMAGKLDNKVEIAIIDRGFYPHEDFPEVYDAMSIVPYKDALNERGGSENPYHGTGCVSAAAAQADNDFGGAGSAGPVAEITMIYSRTDFVSAAIAVAAAAFHGVDIISMSFRTIVPTIVAWTVYPFEDVTEDVRDGGILIFSSAGNENKNVDAEHRCCGISWGEKEWHTPCENNGVICVGGLAYNSQDKHADSNYGSEHVDMWAPFDVYAAPIDPSDTRNVAQFIHGTSFSTPFTAGVAALIWAADPGLSANEVSGILFDTAHGSPDDKVRRYVNALGAVMTALGPQPPTIRITHPPDGFAHPAGHPLTFNAEASDLEDIYPTVFWTSDIDGSFGMGPDWTEEGLSTGYHAITALAYDAVMNEAQDTIHLNVYNSAPVVKILEPLPGTVFCTGESITFRGESFDFNEPPDLTLTDDGVTWEADTAGVLGTGHTITHAFSAGLHTVTFRGVDDAGASDEDTMLLTVDPCVDNPPTVQIVVPSADVEPGDPAWQYDGYDATAGMPYKDVLLNGTATDPEDGVLLGDSLVWTTDRTDLQDAVLGTGAILNARLYGVDNSETHWITLTATDSGGHPRSATRRIIIWAVF